MDIDNKHSKYSNLFNKLISQKRTDNNCYFNLLEYSEKISKVKESKKILITFYGIENIGKILQDSS